MVSLSLGSRAFSYSVTQSESPALLGSFAALRSRPNGEGIIAKTERDWR